MKKKSDGKENEIITNDAIDKSENSAEAEQDLPGVDFRRMLLSIGICLIMLLIAKLLGM